MSFAGSIRGALCFGLAISIKCDTKENTDVLVSSTLALVFVTTIIFGSIMPFVIGFLKKNEHSVNDVKKVEDNSTSRLLELEDKAALERKKKPLQLQTSEKFLFKKVLK